MDTSNTTLWFLSIRWLRPTVFGPNLGLGPNYYLSKIGQTKSEHVKLPFIWRQKQLFVGWHPFSPGCSPFSFCATYDWSNKGRKGLQCFKNLCGFRWFISSTCLPNDCMSALALFQHIIAVCLWLLGHSLVCSQPKLVFILSSEQKQDVCMSSFFFAIILFVTFQSERILCRLLKQTVLWARVITSKEEGGAE